MADIQCAHCGQARSIMNGFTGHKFQAQGANALVRQDLIRATLRCGRCEMSTVFEMTGSAVSFHAGQLFESDLDRNVDDDVREMFLEALSCFYGQGFRGTVAMCRAAVEQALDNKNVNGRDLFKRIEGAKEHGLLGDVQVSQAHGARLSGNEALHQMGAVSQSQGMLALTSCVDLINHINLQEPLPESQSGTGNNAE